MFERPRELASGEAHGASRLLYHDARIALGRFTCPSGHPLWAQDNRTGARAVIAIPGPSVEIRMAGRPTVVAHGGCAMLYNPGQHYARRQLDRQGDRCVFLGAEPDVMREILAARDPAARDRGELFAVARVPLAPATYLAHARLAGRLERGELSRLGAEEAVLALLDAALAGLGPRSPEPTREHRALAHALERHINGRACEDDDLGALAAAVGASASHAARVFRACTGSSMHAYRNHMRLCAALRRLGEPGLDLAALALELGYSSHSHFTTAFRRAFGCPPSAVRGGARARSLQGAGS